MVFACFKNSDTATMARNIELLLEKKVDESLATLGYKKQAFENDVKNVLAELKITSEWPLHTWAYLRAAQIVVEELREHADVDHHDNTELLVDFPVELINKVKAQDHYWAQKYFRSLGKDDAPLKKLDKQEMQAEFQASRAEYFRQIGRHLRKTADAALLRNIDMCNQYYLGLATTNSKPGRPLDVILRASRC